MAQATERPRGTTGSPGAVAHPVQDRQELAATGNLTTAMPATQALNGPSDASFTLEVDPVARLADLLKQEHRYLELSVDQASRRLVIQVIDAPTNQLIRQIPSEEGPAMRRLSSVDRYIGNKRPPTEGVGLSGPRIAYRI